VTEHRTIRLHGGPGLRPEPGDPINNRAIHVLIACTEAQAEDWRRVTRLSSGMSGLLSYFMREGASTVDIRFELDS
jgi:hypothetical protein